MKFLCVFSLGFNTGYYFPTAVMLTGQSFIRSLKPAGFLFHLHYCLSTIRLQITLLVAKVLPTFQTLILDEFLHIRSLYQRELIFNFFHKNPQAFYKY